MGRLFCPPCCAVAGSPAAPYHVGVTSIAPPPLVTYGAIHFANAFPVARTTCSQARVPAAASWTLVTCPRCLEVGAGLCEPARARRQQLIVEAAERARRTA